MIGSSYESEQHLLHFGGSDSPVGWTVCGLASGYLSRSTGKEIYVLEDRCLACGDSACHLLGRTRVEWGEARAQELLFFDQKGLVECLDVSLHRVTETLKMMEEKIKKHERMLIRLVPEVDPPSGIVAKSAEMRQLLDLTRRMAKVDVTVAISGESGTGKERIARLLHDESVRATGPFIAINCAAITESLLESELFGHARGSFSGALHDRPGLFEAANGGTLLLDEIGELPLGMQTKLLRVLQEREIRRVGENKSRPINVRIVAASNIDLEAAVEANTFRQDLYYRLKIVALHVPPLRERREDILPLAHVLVTEASIRMSREPKNLDTAAADRLLAYPWPGNVRELENAMERAVALSEGPRIGLADLPEEVRRLKTTPPAAYEQDRALHEVEKEYILASLEKNGGNQARTSEQLKIGSATLYRKLKSYGALGTKGP
jgi:transcriptional regulator with PAS, ATPase and Fis domain